MRVGSPTCRMYTVPVTAAVKSAALRAAANAASCLWQRPSATSSGDWRRRSSLSCRTEEQSSRVNASSPGSGKQSQRTRISLRGNRRQCGAAPIQPSEVINVVFPQYTPARSSMRYTPIHSSEVINAVYPNTLQRDHQSSQRDVPCSRESQVSASTAPSQAVPPLSPATATAPARSKSVHTRPETPEAP